MYTKSLIVSVFFAFVLLSHAQTDQHKIFINTIFEKNLTMRSTYNLLEQLCREHPKRLSGSAGLGNAIIWTKSVMEELGFDNVYLQQVMVPHWERGEKESAEYINSKGKRESLALLALGGSVSTPAEGITAGVVQVNTLEEIAQLGQRIIKGKIVFINKPFEHQHVRTFDGYKETVRIRSNGPSQAARFGAIACVIRSVSSADDDYPHTGSLNYAAGIGAIPGAALGVRSADKLSKALAHNPEIKLTLKINSKTLADKISYNVIGELRGSENPGKFIVVGGHLDAWDVGQGAHDDGAGCMQSIVALKTLKDLDYRPRNTMRVVLFTNEENGIRGAETYAAQAVLKKEEHVFAFESDAGAFAPRMIGVKGPLDLIQKISSWTEYFPEYSIEKIKLSSAPADLSALYKVTQTPVATLITDPQRYFDFHHSDADVFEAVNARELEMGTSSVASFIYLVDQLGL